MNIPLDYEILVNQKEFLYLKHREKDRFIALMKKNMCRIGNQYQIVLGTHLRYDPLHYAIRKIIHRTEKKEDALRWLEKDILRSRRY